MMADLEAQFGFLRAIDALKDIERASPIISMKRRENSAEHSWHLAMFACILADHAEDTVSIARVIEMLLIHDIVEIDAGDVPLHSAHQPEEQAAKEQQAADRLFGLLPADQGQRLRALWDEFEAATTPDARFAKALDRLQPVLQNLATGGGTWGDYDVSEQQVLDRVAPSVKKGAPGLWAAVGPMVHAHFARAK